MNVIEVDVGKTKLFSIGQQYNRNALVIHFVNLPAQKNKYIYYKIDDIEEEIPLVSDLFIVSRPLMLHSGEVKAQIITRDENNSTIELTNNFTMRIKPSNYSGIGEDESYPDDPNIKNYFVKIDEKLNSFEELANLVQTKLDNGEFVGAQGPKGEPGDVTEEYRNLAGQIAQNASDAQTSATNAQTSATNAQKALDDTKEFANQTKTGLNQIKTDTSLLKDEANTSAVNAKASEDKAKEYANNLQESTDDISQLKEDKADYRVYTYGKKQSSSLLDTKNENKINIFSKDVFQFGKNMITIPDKEPETIKGVTYYVKNNILHINGTCTGWTGDRIIATGIPFPEVLFGKLTTVSAKIVEGDITESDGYPQWNTFGKFGSQFGVAYRQTKTLTSINNNNIVFAMASGSTFNDVQVKFYLGFDKDYTDDFRDGYKKAVIGEISTIDGYLCKIDGSNFDYAESVSETTVAYLKDIEKFHNANILYGKKWIACGDSFTHGDFTGYTDSDGDTGEFSDAYDQNLKMYKTYPWWIAKRNDMNLINEARNGSGFTNAYGIKSPFSLQRYKDVPKDCDYITLMFGLNEIALAKNSDTIGTKESSDNTTIWGAYNVVLEYFYTNMPYAKIGVILADSWMTPAYANVIKEICEYWGVPVLDLKNPAVPLGIGGRLNGSQKAMELKNKAFKVTDSNEHPNLKAHEYRSTFIENWMRTL